MRLINKLLPILTAAIAMPLAVSSAQPAPNAQHAATMADPKPETTCKATTTYPDGHSITIAPDGTVSATFVDKHAVTTTPDGRTITSFPDGSRIVTSSDQSSVTTTADGRVRAMSVDPKKMKDMGGKMKEMGGKMKQMGGKMKQPDMDPSQKQVMGGMMMDMSGNMMAMGGMMSGDTAKPADPNASQKAQPLMAPPAPIAPPAPMAPAAPMPHM